MTEDELDRQRDDFREGRATMRIEEEVFDLGAYHALIEAEKDSIATFRATQQAAFTEEVSRWNEDAAIAALEDQAPVDDDLAGE